MINHARTLLLNSARGDFAADFPGEEYVPVDFVPKKLPPALAKVRSVLFGSDPDRCMLNYRLRQYMQILHATPLEKYVLQLDPRVTYLPFTVKDLYRLAFTPLVTANLGGQLYLSGDSRIPNNSDKLLRQWNVTVLSGDTVRIQQTAPEAQTTTAAYTLAGGLSNRIALPNSSLSFHFRGNIGDNWDITAIARPAASVPDVLDRLVAVLTVEDENDLFGSVPVEPYTTFYGLWHGNEMLPYRLGGLLLATIFRTDEL